MSEMTSSVRVRVDELVQLHQFPDSPTWDWRCYLCEDEGRESTRRLAYMAALEHLKSSHGAADLWLVAQARESAGAGGERGENVGTTRDNSSTP